MPSDARDPAPAPDRSVLEAMGELTGRLDRLEEELVSAQAAVTSGQVVILAGLEPRVEVLCADIVAGGSVVRCLLPHLGRLIDRLDGLETQLRLRQQAIRCAAGEAGDSAAARQRASRVYNRSSGGDE